MELINSTIRRADDRASFFFKAETGSELIFRNADIEKCGYNGGTADKKGIYIGTNNALISDSRFNGSIYALSVINSSPTIRNSSFENSSTGIYSSASHAEITNCRFFDNTFGYMSVSSGDRIENSTFTGNIYGIKAQYASVQISNVSLTGGTYGVYFSYSAPTLENLSVAGATYGTYAYSSTIVSDKSTITGGNYGFYAYGSTYRLVDMKSDVLYDLYSISSRGSIRNSSLNGSGISLNGGGLAIFDTYISPTKSIDAVRFSAINLINTTGNRWDSHGPLNVDEISLIRYGNYARLTVMNDSGTPLANCTIVALNDDLSVFIGKTNSTGSIYPFPFINWTADNKGERKSNATIYARWNSTTENLSGSYDGLLQADNNVGLYLHNQSTSNITWLHDRSIGIEEYTGRTVVVGRGTGTTSATNLTVTNSTVVLVNSLSSSGILHIINSSIMSGAADETLSPREAGISINSGSTARISNSSFLSTPIKVYADDCNISHSSFSRISTGIYVNSASPEMNDIKIGRGFTGLYLYAAHAKITTTSIYLYDTGIREYSGRNTVQSTELRNCTTAISSTTSSSIFERINTSTVRTAFSLHSSNVVLEKCNLSALTGVDCISSSPSISNSSIDSELKIRAISRSFPAVLDTEINQSTSQIDITSFITIGGYGKITVVDNTGSLVDGVPVSLFDRFGPSAYEVTDDNGTAYVSGRYSVLTAKGYESVKQEAISWAEDAGITYFARDKYLPGMNLTLRENSSVIYYPTSHYVPSAGEIIENKTLILGDNITVPDGRKLTIRSSKVFAGSTQFRVFGSFEVENSHVRSYLTSAPGIAHRYFPYFWNSQMSWINSSIFDNPEEIDSYNRNLQIDGLWINNAGNYGLRVQNSDTQMKNINIRGANVGLYFSQGWPNIRNISIENCTSGIQLIGDMGEIGNITATNCMNGAYIQTSDMYIEQANTDANSGIYLYKSKVRLENASIRGINYGINLRNSDMSLTNSIIRDSGKGLFSVSSTLRAGRNSFLNNSDSALYMSASGGEIANNTFEGNNIGLFLYSSNPRIENNSFSENTVGIKIQSSYPHIENCSFNRNNLGIQTVTAALSLKNSIMKNNSIAVDMNGDYAGDIIGDKTAFLTFMTGGKKDISLPLPLHSSLENMKVTLTGLKLGWVPIRRDNYIQRDADISGGAAVWADYRTGNYDIYLRNISADDNGNSVPDIFEMPFQNRDAQLTKERNSQGIPVVSGHIVAWKNFSSDGRGQVILYDINNRTSWNITPMATLSDIAIYGNIVAWSQKSGSNRDIFAYSITNQTTWQVTHTPDDEYSPSIWRDRIVWYSSNITLATQRSNIVFYNITTGKIYNITNDSYLEFNPSIWGNYLAWHDNSRGDVTGDGVDDQIVKIMNIGPDGIPATGDDFKVGESQGWESAFNPSLSKNWAVWYYHNRTTDRWGTMAMNLTSGEIECISSNDGGDSQPHISGSRVIRMDKTDSDWDVYLMDLNSRGRPVNVSVDMSSGKYGIRNTTGDFTSLTFGYPLIEAGEKAGEIRAAMDSESAGIVRMDVSVSMKVTSSISSTSITFPDNIGFTGINARYTTLQMENSSLESGGGWPLNATAFLLFTSRVDTLNCSVGWGGADLSGGSKILVRNYLDILVINESGVQVRGAHANVKANGKTVYDRTTGANGHIRWLKITDRIIDDSGIAENSTEVVISYPLLFPVNPRAVNMSRSHTEIFRSDESAPNIWVSSPYRVYAGGSNLTIEWAANDTNIKENSTSIYLENISSSTAELLEENLTEKGNYTITLPRQNGWFAAAVSSKDTVGHTSKNRTHPFYIDSEKPEINLITPENGSVIPGDSCITLQFSDHTNMTVRFHTGNSTWQSVNLTNDDYNLPKTAAVNITTEDWPEGNITLVVEVNDEAGHTNSTTFLFVVDRTAPDINIGPSEPVVKSGTPVNYTVSDEHLREVVVSVNGDVIENLTSSPYRGTISTDRWADGDYFIEITARDAAGNAAAEILNITIDNIPPAFYLPEGNIVGDDEHDLLVIITDLHLSTASLITPFHTEKLNLSGIEDTIILNTSGWSDGRYGISVEADDMAGNTATFVFTLTVDRNAPQFTVSYPNSVNISENISIKFNITDLSGVDSVILKYRTNETENWTIIMADAEGGSVIIPAQNNTGIIEFYIEARDAAGNTGRSEFFFINITGGEQGQSTPPQEGNKNNNTNNDTGNNDSKPPDSAEEEPSLRLYLPLSIIIIAMLMLILAAIARNRKREKRKTETEENTDIEEDNAPPWN